jgi:hypothetical protein
MDAQDGRANGVSARLARERRIQLLRDMIFVAMDEAKGLNHRRRQESAKVDGFTLSRIAAKAQLKSADQRLTKTSARSLRINHIMTCAINHPLHITSSHPSPLCLHPYE